MPPSFVPETKGIALEDLGKVFETPTTQWTQFCAWCQKFWRHNDQADDSAIGMGSINGRRGARA